MDQTKDKEKEPLITVLLPCYNAMPFLEEALSSIREHTYANLEILCIDDGSEDDTYNYLIEQAALDSRIVVVKNERNLKLNGYRSHQSEFQQSISIAKFF